MPVNSGEVQRRRRITQADVNSMRAAGVARVAIATVAAVFGLVGAPWWEGSVTVLFLVAGLVWLPWSIVLLLATSERAGRGRNLSVAAYGGPLGDVLIVFAAQCLVPWAWGLLLLADALAVSLAASLWRRREAWMLLAVCVTLTMLAQAFVPVEDRVAAGLLVLFAVAMGGLVVVVGPHRPEPPAGRGQLPPVPAEGGDDPRPGGRRDRRDRRFGRRRRDQPGR